MSGASTHSADFESYRAIQIHRALLLILNLRIVWLYFDYSHVWQFFCFLSYILTESFLEKVCFTNKMQNQILHISVIFIFLIIWGILNTSTHKGQMARCSPKNPAEFRGRCSYIQFRLGFGILCMRESSFWTQFHQQTSIIFFFSSIIQLINTVHEIRDRL